MYTPTSRLIFILSYSDLITDLYLLTNKLEKTLEINLNKNKLNRKCLYTSKISIQDPGFYLQLTPMSRSVYCTRVKKVCLRDVVSSILTELMLRESCHIIFSCSISINEHTFDN